MISSSQEILNLEKIALAEAKSSVLSDSSAKKPAAKKHWKAYSTVLGGFILMIYPGSANCTEVFSTYIASYYGLPKTSNIV